MRNVIAVVGVILLGVIVYGTVCAIQPIHQTPVVLSGEYNGVSYVAYKRFGDVEVELLKMFRYSGLPKFKYAMIGEGVDYTTDGQTWTILRLDQVPLVFEKQAKDAYDYEALQESKRKIFKQLEPVE
jgi:hypothetical protein